ncbi:hypothetical protein HDU97_003253 [Phlyctochytrium planicorne]|nr:hypothetical protein HDU97_003253 [Phlyctochytrium planicorne]
MLFKTIVSLALSAVAVSSQSLLEVLGKETGETSVATLLAAVSAQKEIATTLTTITTNLTVFAPVDSAFAKLPKGALDNSTVVSDILQYHAVLGTTFAPTVDGSYVLNAVRPNPKNFGNPTNLVATLNSTAKSVEISYGLAAAKVLKSATFNNGTGIVHFVDSVLLPPQPVTVTATTAKLDGLVGAVTAAGIAAGLDSLQGLTIFAPVNAAFEAIASTAASLTKDQLTGVLGFHVVPAVVFSTQLVPALKESNGTLSVPTYLGQNITITSTAEGIFVAGVGNKTPAKIVKTDILVDSGVVHLISDVLLPNVTAIPSPVVLKQINPDTKPATTTTATGPVETKPVSTAAPTTSKPSSAGSNTVSVMALVAVVAAAFF